MKLIFLHTSLLILNSIVISCSCKKSKAADTVAPNRQPVLPAGKSYYVSAVSGSDANNGLFPAASFKRISTAADKAVGGNTVFIMNGVYASSSGPVLNITKSGTVDKYITFKTYPGHKSSSS